GTVLEGSVRKDRNRLRITVRLSNVADGFCLWSDRYDRGLEDIFAIQDEIAENTVRVLRGVFSDEDRRRLQAMPRAKIEAYEYYLRGRRFFLSADEAGSRLRPPDVFERDLRRSGFRFRLRRAFRRLPLPV